MEQVEWTRIFELKTEDLNPGHSWRLEFDENIEHGSLNQGWQQYIRTTSGGFKCSKCKRTWPSNKVTVVFHMHLMNGQGIVKVRRFRQDCKKCTEAPMERPSINSENIDILLENLMKNIRKKFYNEHQDHTEKHFRRVLVKSPHEPSHCEACKKGICTNNLAFEFNSLSI